MTDTILGILLILSFLAIITCSSLIMSLPPGTLGNNVAGVIGVVAILVFYGITWRALREVDKWIEGEKKKRGSIQDD